MKTPFTPLASETDASLCSDNNDVTTLLLPEVTPAEQIEQLTLENQFLQQELRRAQQQLESLHAQQLKLREEERKAIAQDLHDEFGQHLVALKIDLDLAIRAQQKATGSLDPQPEWQHLYHTLDACASSVSNVIANIRTPNIEAASLLQKIDTLFIPLQKQGITVTKHIAHTTFCMDACTATEVYHILQEAVTNIARHAQATQVTFAVDVTPTLAYHFQAADNGIGIQKKDTSTTCQLGLTGMQERAYRLAASLCVSQNMPSGTVIDLVVPSSNPVA
jgi:signal transduction histidine kinase